MQGLPRPAVNLWWIYCTRIYGARVCCGGWTICTGTPVVLVATRPCTREVQGFRLVIVQCRGADSEGGPTRTEREARPREGSRCQTAVDSQGPLPTRADTAGQIHRVTLRPLRPLQQVRKASRTLTVCAWVSSGRLGSRDLTRVLYGRRALSHFMPRAASSESPRAHTHGCEPGRGPPGPGGPGGRVVRAAAWWA